ARLENSPPIVESAPAPGRNALARAPVPPFSGPVDRGFPGCAPADSGNPEPWGSRPPAFRPTPTPDGNGRQQPRARAPPPAVRPAYCGCPLSENDTPGRRGIRLSARSGGPGPAGKVLAPRQGPGGRAARPG